MRLLARALLLAAVGAFAFYLLFPVYWALNTALTPREKLAALPVSWMPAPPSFGAFAALAGNGELRRGLGNSLAAATATTAACLALGAMAGCALGRIRFRGRRAMMYLLLSMTMFPQIAIVGSLFHLARQAGLFDTIAGLALSHLLVTLPFAVWVLAGFFRELPRDLEESATVDGATPFQTFWRILLPLVLPGLATVGLLTFISSWNEYLFALALTQPGGARTLPVEIAQFRGASQYEIPWNEIMAASLAASAPLVALVLVFQRWVVGGLTAGSVKG